jgi:hypothetical protein
VAGGNAGISESLPSYPKIFCQRHRLCVSLVQDRQDRRGDAVLLHAVHDRGVERALAQEPIEPIFAVT